MLTLSSSGSLNCRLTIASEVRLSGRLTTQVGVDEGDTVGSCVGVAVSSSVSLDHFDNSALIHSPIVCEGCSSSLRIFIEEEEGNVLNTITIVIAESIATAFVIVLVIVFFFVGSTACVALAPEAIMDFIW